MKKLLILILITAAFAVQPLETFAQLGYDQGYGDGHRFAVERCLIALEAHPEWSFELVHRTYFYTSGGVLGMYDSWTAVSNDAQAAMLAVNYVRVSYDASIQANSSINEYYRGYADGFLQGTADFVLGN